MKIKGGVRHCQGSVFVVTSLAVLAFDCLIKYILIVCCLIVAVPSGKRETERKGNAPVNTGPSPNSNERKINAVDEADEHARGSGLLHSSFLRFHAFLMTL
ncbi:hypothetical protein T07_285 [Trichinella nelsoni]|uniref:Uncharacterized protein n=1 Tax=Trichinella nelsoni TaxID=6336 RepID=A0A0V0RG16_9BILA|nr:hypothetical protein T07_285 [Trichinella nelsoni]